MPTWGVDIDVSTAGFEAKVARIPQTVKKATQGASREMNALAKSSNSAANGLRAVSTQIPDVVSQLSMGADPLQVLTQQGLQVVEVMGGIPAVLGAIGPMLLPLTALVAAGATAWSIYAVRTAEADAIASNMDAQIASLQATMDPAHVREYGDAVGYLADQEELLSERLAIATGDLTDTEAAIGRETRAIRERTDAAIVSAKADYVRVETSRLLAEARVNEAAAEGDVERARAAREAIDRASMEGPRLLARVKALEEERDTILEQAQATVLAEDAAKKKAERDREGARAARERASEQERLAAALERERQAAAEDWMEQRAREAADMEKERLAKIKEEEANLKRMEAERQAAHLAEMQRIAREKEMRTAAIYSAGDAFTAMGQIAGSAGERYAKFQKGAAMMGAAVNTAEAITKASASAPFPWNLIPISAAALTGAAQIATIKAADVPQYYIGKPSSYMTGPSLGYMDPRERVLTSSSQSSLTDDDVRRANRGERIGGGGVSHVWLDGREISAAVARDDRKTGRIKPVNSRPVGRHMDR